ncbi:outer membrane lipoprotein carrier protein LolA [Fodinisporobacter ferrooxydans]|uniref:Outer membrane lipoprotein carrier protein LolA n=1 Tax=Fodinisporobacter ferrooxydans TaxID=2901836 RepID=A0ABY4CP01_9BACL|nr:outer membrane lipoprotein carrier protein LolA [Alicyclobacillaceae bacterium MYW30-H2]
MRKYFRWLLTLLLVMGLGLAGCGIKTSDSVVKELDHVSKSLTSYKSTAMMSVKMQNSIQKYYIETWYQAPDEYRIALGNENKEISQVIVKNKEGIFIVSPQLKKTFRFKGEWAENQGHIYLYHSVIHRILDSKDKHYSSGDGYVAFDMPMNPENPLVARQKIELDAKTLYPKQVILLDRKDTPIVTVQYDSFKTGVSFDKDAFDPQKALALAQNSDVAVMAGSKDFGVVEPAYLPIGTKKLAQDTETDHTILIRYAGQHPLTLVEERPAPKESVLTSGTLYDIYGLPIILTGTNDARTMYWLNHNVQYSLSSSMPIGEMEKVAASTMASVGK